MGTQCRVRSGPALQALMMGQVGREAETQARMTALCDNKLQHPQLRKVEGARGAGGCMVMGGVWRGHGRKLILQQETVRSLQMDGNWIQDYMVMIQFSVNDKMADPIC